MKVPILKEFSNEPFVSDQFAMSGEGSLTVAELKCRLAAAGLPVSGKKQDLVTRLLAAAGGQAAGSGIECTW